jgi:hypothetical protein
MQHTTQHMHHDRKHEVTLSGGNALFVRPLEADRATHQVGSKKTGLQVQAGCPRLRPPTAPSPTATHSQVQNCCTEVEPCPASGFNTQHVPSAVRTRSRQSARCSCVAGQHHQNIARRSIHNTYTEPWQTGPLSTQTATALRQQHHNPLTQHNAATALGSPLNRQH